MSPLNIEAVYERIPAWDASPARSSVRWGFRATFANPAPESQDEPSPTPPPLVPPLAAQAGETRRPGSSGPPRRPREADDPDPGLLVYTREGKPVPLTLVAAGPRAGRLLDLRA